MLNLSGVANHVISLTHVVVLILASQSYQPADGSSKCTFGCLSTNLGRLYRGTLQVRIQVLERSGTRVLRLKIYIQLLLLETAANLLKLGSLILRRLYF